jgi:hypothetical protein
MYNGKSGDLIPTIRGSGAHPGLGLGLRGWGSPSRVHWGGVVVDRGAREVYVYTSGADDDIFYMFLHDHCRNKKVGAELYIYV